LRIPRPTRRWQAAFKKERRFSFMTKLKIPRSNKPDKLAKRKLGEIVRIDYGRDSAGMFWWRERSPTALPHGPFPTLTEAKRDSEVATFGSQCVIKEAGRWDPAWERKQ
jgi:hypothetical protein